MGFVVGQKVELINNSSMSLIPLGATAKVIKYNNGFVRVVWDKHCDQRPRSYFPSRFKSSPIKNQQLLFSFMTP